MPRERVPSLRGERRVGAEPGLGRAGPLGVRGETVRLARPGRKPRAVRLGRGVRHADRGIALVAGAPVGGAVGITGAGGRVRRLAPPAPPPPPPPPPPPVLA